MSIRRTPRGTPARRACFRGQQPPRAACQTAGRRVPARRSDLPL